MAVAVTMLVLAIGVLAAWCARLDYLLGKVLDRERERIEAEAARLRAL